MSPYEGVGFFEFFMIFFSRLFSKDLLVLTSLDEIQIFVFLGLSISGAFVGSFVVLRNMAMFGNALSHTIIFGLVCAFLFAKTLSLSVTTLALAALSTAMLTGLLVRIMKDVFSVSEDSGVTFSFSLIFSLGLLFLVFLTKNAHVGTELVIGNADALSREDVILAYYVAALNACLTLIFFRGLKILSFDYLFGRTIGFPVKFLNYLITIQISMTLVASFKAVGVLMALAFLIFPGLIAKMLAKTLLGMLFWAMSFSIAVSMFSPAVSRAILSYWGVGVSTAGVAVLLFVSVYFLIAWGKKVSFIIRRGAFSQTQIN
ncbi:metal ABC transporter permease [Chlamydiifrater phoenicopteri]|uniref:metal ABC transporter permease n=1 Tax=Chlamydiifrater phoenicopteri TaxID=2681469 RepID=UPI001BD09D92|nr:metal ABC transporter permease [Chlamydiifrater phoenicopteri]